MNSRIVQRLSVAGLVIAVALAVFAFSRQQQAAGEASIAATREAAAMVVQATAVALAYEANTQQAIFGNQQITAVARSNAAVTNQALARGERGTAIAERDTAQTQSADAISTATAAYALIDISTAQYATAESQRRTAVANANTAVIRQVNAEHTAAAAWATATRFAAPQVVTLIVVITTTPPPPTPITPRPTALPTIAATGSATSELPPTIERPQLEITEVRGVGDITQESVVIRNIGSTINLEGWTLSNNREVIYTFGRNLLFSNGQIVVNSRVGQNTPVALYINSSLPIWDDVIVLKDSQGNVHASLRVADLP